MNDLTSRALELQHAAHELMYLGMDGEPVYSDTFCRLNKEVLVKSDSLFSAQSSDVEEEANLFLLPFSISMTARKSSGRTRWGATSCQRFIDGPFFLYKNNRYLQ